ncbi:MAG: WG repeat-containing protein [Moraxella sp.]|nr:WG repeat-containing protein [Moraxella sp.]
MGIKDDNSNVIIEPSHFTIRYYDYNFPITTPYIEFFGANIDDNYPKNTLAYPFGEVYDRQGKFLYNALAFDNGFDYWQEGLRRYVDNNGKVGFVNKKGDIIIPVNYDYVSAFQYGYALVYTGNWQKDCNSDCIGFKAVDDTAKTYFINQKGEKIDGYDTPKHPKDRFYQGKYYPYPFVYNAFEQKLLDELKDLNKDSYLEITEKPTDYFPYYRIEVFDKQSFILDNDFSYLINANGQVFEEKSYGTLTFIEEIALFDE